MERNNDSKIYRLEDKLKRDATPQGKERFDNKDGTPITTMFTYLYEKTKDKNLYRKSKPIDPARNQNIDNESTDNSIKTMVAQ